MLIPVIDVNKTSLKLKELRENRELKVSDLQALFNMENPQSIYDWENPEKKNLPRLDNLVILSKFYGIKIDEMIILRKDCIESTLSDCYVNYGLDEDLDMFIVQNTSISVRNALADFYKLKF